MGLRAGLDGCGKSRPPPGFDSRTVQALNFNKFNNLVTLANTSLRLSEDDADAMKHVAVLTIYKILLIYMLCFCWSG